MMIRRIATKAQATSAVGSSMGCGQEKDGHKYRKSEGNGGPDITTEQMLNVQDMPFEGINTHLQMPILFLMSDGHVTSFFGVAVI